MLPKAKRTSREHHPALPYAELPAFMAELRAMPGIAARALEFTILTAVRTSEARFARWSEVDLRTGVWTVPGERMKGDKEHRVPLTERALAICASFRAMPGAMLCSPAAALAGSSIRTRWRTCWRSSAPA